MPGGEPRVVLDVVDHHHELALQQAGHLLADRSDRQRGADMLVPALVPQLEAMIGVRLRVELPDAGALDVERLADRLGDRAQRLLDRRAAQQLVAHQLDQQGEVAPQRGLAPVDLVLQQRQADQVGDRARERLLLDRPVAASAVGAERDVADQAIGMADARIQHRYRLGARVGLVDQRAADRIGASVDRAVGQIARQRGAHVGQLVVVRVRHAAARHEAAMRRPSVPALQAARHRAGLVVAPDRRQVEPEHLGGGLRDRAQLAFESTAGEQLVLQDADHGVLALAQHEIAAFDRALQVALPVAQQHQHAERRQSEDDRHGVGQHWPVEHQGALGRLVEHEQRRHQGQGEGDTKQSQRGQPDRATALRTCRRRRSPGGRRRPVGPPSRRPAGRQTPSPAPPGCCGRPGGCRR